MRQTLAEPEASSFFQVGPVFNTSAGNSNQGPHVCRAGTFAQVAISLAQDSM